MPDSGSILVRHGDKQALVAIDEWSYAHERPTEPSWPYYICDFHIRWSNEYSPDIMVGGKLRLAGKNFLIRSIRKVTSWGENEIEVTCRADEENG